MTLDCHSHRVDLLTTETCLSRMNCRHLSHAPLPQRPLTPGLELSMPIVSGLTRTHSLPKDQWLHDQRAWLSQLSPPSEEPEP